MSAPVYGVHLRDKAPLLLVVAPTGTQMARLRSVQLVGVTSTTTVGAMAGHPLVSRPTTLGSTYTTVSPYIVAAFQPTTVFEGRHTYTTAPDLSSGPTSSWRGDIDWGINLKMSWPQGSGMVFGQYGVGVYATANTWFRWSGDIHFEVL